MHTFLNSSTLASLRFFEATARLLSFKRAAAELSVTQGAVSQQVKHLEDALGCRLFERLPRGIALTRQGEQFAAVVGRALEEIESAAREIAKAAAKVTIRLRAGPSFALRWLVPRIGGFYRQHPAINLFILAEYGALDTTHRGFDLAIEMIGADIDGLCTERLLEERLIPVCSPRYLAEHPLEKPSDLNGCTLLHDAHAFVGGAPEAEWEYWLAAVGARGVDASQGQFFTLANMSLEAALADQGVALGRGALIGDLLSEGKLVAPFKDAVKSRDSYCLVYRKERARSPGMTEVMQWLREQVREWPVTGRD